MNMTATASFAVTRVAAGLPELFDDVVAVEEPLELLVAWRANGEPREKNISVTMRTPGDDFDFAAGFLYTEGLIRSSSDIDSIRHWSSPNRVRIQLRDGVRLDTSKLGRNFYTTSACGVCGKTSIDALTTSVCAVPAARPIPRAIITSAARLLHDAQSAFHETGGVHGAALVSFNGELLAAREDVGRHNAVDKVVGALLRSGSAFNETMLVVSSRASFEIVQKAVVAGIPALISIGAPSSLAIDLARQFNVALVGFVREGRFNVYAGAVE